MAGFEYGAQQTNDDDRAYAGSRFRDVVEAVFANPYQRVWGRPGEPPMPVHEVTLTGVLGGVPPFGSSPIFTRASERTLDSAADLRWGPDRRGFRRIVHPNGVCLVGRWRINKANSYSGYFSQGREALVIGRYSTCCSDTQRGSIRSLALVGKLYPTTDPDHPMPLRTANFMTQEDIGGARSDSINVAELRNAPDVTATRRVAGLPTLLKIGLVFNDVDREPGIRQLYPIAELGKPADAPTRAPQFMRLLVSPGQPVVQGDRLDFRDEIMAHIFDPGDPVPKRTLSFVIEVTDEGSTSGNALRLRRTFRGWTSIGELVFDNAVVSYNSDSVLHFSHPTWRSDRNDPATATRVGERKVT